MNEIHYVRRCSWRGKEIAVGAKAAKPFHYADGDFVYEMKQGRQSISSVGNSSTSKWQSPEHFLKPRTGSKINKKVVAASLAEYDPNNMSLRAVFPKYVSLQQQKNSGSDSDETIDHSISLAYSDIINVEDSTPIVLTDVKNDNSFQIFVRLQNRESIMIDLFPSSKVPYVKKLIEMKAGILSRQQKLLFCGRELDDDDSALSSWGITSNSVLTLVVVEGSTFKSRSQEISDKLRCLSEKFSSPTAYAKTAPHNEAQLVEGIQNTNLADANDSIQYIPQAAVHSPESAPEFQPVTPSGKAIANALKDLMDKKRKTLQTLQNARGGIHKSGQ
jgi:hypothetical protein